MFRYIGFHWDPASPVQSAVALRLAQAIQDAKDWQPALSLPGFRVHTIGSRAGVNDIYPLAHGAGVILGRLFSRLESGSVYQSIDSAPGNARSALPTDERSLIDHYWGRYIAFLVKGQSGTFVLRDPSGALPCFRSDIEGVVVIFSWLEDLMAFAPHRALPRVRWDAVAAHLALGLLGGRDTALENLRQILPGQLTALDNRDAPPTKLWSAAVVAAHSIELEPSVAAARLRREVMDCVQAWTSCHDAVLLRLSGGVDSAILLGSMAARPSATRIACLNYHSPGSDSDERRYARLAASKAGVELIEKERDHDFRLDDVLDVSRTPTPQNYVGCMGTGRVDAAVAATHRARAMFTGGGGDTLFFQFRCTWPAADFLSAHGPGRGFARASLDAARLARVSIWQSVWRAMADQRHRTSPLDCAGEFLSLARPEALDVPRLDRYVHPDLLGESSLPIGKFHQLQDLVTSPSYYDPYLREAAPEVVNPLLSQPLVELCLGLPTWLLTHGGRGRALARQAFARELPREIATRQSKGGMEEHVTTILHRNLALVRELLLDGQLVHRGLLDRQKVESVLAGTQPVLSGHAGEIHRYIAVEAWLSRFAPSTRT